MAIYVRLKELRENAGMTQMELAIAAGMAVSSIQKIEGQQNKSMPYETLEKLCVIFNCEPGDVIILKRGD